MKNQTRPMKQLISAPRDLFFGLLMGLAVAATGACGTSSSGDDPPASPAGSGGQIGIDVVPEGTAGAGGGTGGMTSPMGAGGMGGGQSGGTTTSTGTGGMPMVAPPPVVNVAPMVSGGGLFSLALRRDGTVFGWGDETVGALGNGEGGETSTRHPQRVLTLTSIIRIAAGDSHSLALRADGAVFSWGSGIGGDLGIGVPGDASTAVRASSLADIVEIAAGKNTSFAVRADGTLFAWGANQYGQLGLGHTQDQSTPVAVPGISDVVAISAGHIHNMALRRDGSLWVWGGNLNGQLGLGDREPRLVPTQVLALAGEKVALIAAGGFHSLALVRGKALIGWGASFVGQTGAIVDPANPYGEILTPTIAFKDFGFTALAAGEEHSMGLLASGQVATWGHNGSGRLGNGESGRTHSTPDPQLAIGVTNAIGIDAGKAHSLVVHADGQVSCFGYNFFSQCGRIETTDLPVPGPVGPGFSVGEAP